MLFLWGFSVPTWLKKTLKIQIICIAYKNMFTCYVITAINKIKKPKIQASMLNTHYPIGCHRKYSWSLQNPVIWWQYAVARGELPWDLGAGLAGWEVGAGRRTWGRDCHLLDSIFKPLPAQPCTRQGTAEQATFVVQAPDKLFRDCQAENAIARTRVAHPALCKLTRTEASEFRGKRHCFIILLPPTTVGKRLKRKGLWEALLSLDPVSETLWNRSCGPHGRPHNLPG